MLWRSMELTFRTDMEAQDGKKAVLLFDVLAKDSQS